MVGAGVISLAGALLHLAIPIGGPAWYAAFGAPRRLVALAEAGAPYALVSCFAIATVLLVFAGYAFSAAGLIRRLPLLRPVLALIACVLILRGLLFIPMILWRPDSLARICDCNHVDFFIISTSLLCATLGGCFAFAALTRPWIPTTLLRR